MCRGREKLCILKHLATLTILYHVTISMTRFSVNFIVYIIIETYEPIDILCFSLIWAVRNLAQRARFRSKYLTGPFVPSTPLIVLRRGYRRAISIKGLKCLSSAKSGLFLQGRTRTVTFLFHCIYVRVFFLYIFSRW